MQIRLLGTGGADGIPALYSDSRVSAYARLHKGKDVRTRSAALLDGTIKIDLGPDTWHQLARDGLDARDWTAVFFTHSDADHFAVDELQYALYPFSDFEYAGFQIFGNAAVCRRIMEAYPEWPFEIHMTESFQTLEHDGYKVTPVRAKHKESEDAHNFLFECTGSTLMYATDTGVWPEETWEFLQGWKLDTLVIECTEGFVHTPYNGHLDVKDLLLVVERLQSMGVVHSETVMATTHHSHNGDATHAELEEALGPHGILVGYDGMTLEA